MGWQRGEVAPTSPPPPIDMSDDTPHTAPKRRPACFPGVNTPFGIWTPTPSETAIASGIRHERQVQYTTICEPRPSGCGKRSSSATLPAFSPSPTACTTTGPTANPGNTSVTPRSNNAVPIHGQPDHAISHAMVVSLSVTGLSPTEPNHAGGRWMRSSRCSTTGGRSGTTADCCRSKAVHLKRTIASTM